jgi:prepilin-type N-terminal cleavage/methylation domain-containing protein
VIQRENGFTLIEILVALILTAMTLVAVNQLVTGAVRARKTAGIIASAATLADQAMEYALLSAGVAETALQDLIQQAGQSGLTLSISRSPAPISVFQTLCVKVSGNALPYPIEINRLVRQPDQNPGGEE